MDVVEAVRELGGACSRRTLLERCDRTAIGRALTDGVLLRDARGRYSLPDCHRGVRIANSVGGVLSHRSAAAYHGWEQKNERGLPEVTVPRTRRIHRNLRTILIPHWSALHDDDVVGCVTTKRRTLVDCFRNLPYDEALSIADSALRAGDVTQQDLLEIAATTRGCGRRRIICVAEDATDKSANPLESVVRAWGNIVPGLSAVSQLPVETDDGRTLHPDLGSPELGVLIETEGYESHGTPQAHDQDCRRFNIFVLLGWTLLRFSWRQVTFEPETVHQALCDLVRLARRGPPEHAHVAAAA